MLKNEARTEKRRKSSSEDQIYIEKHKDDKYKGYILEYE